MIIVETKTDYVVHNNSCNFIESPKLSDWECKLFGHKGTGLTWRPIDGEHPNIFWRWMQYICFGNRWYKVKDGKLQ